METTRELGGYCLGEIVRLHGSFQTNGTGAPTVIRDGHSTLTKSAVRTSAGLYTVTLASGMPVPQIPIDQWAHLESSATPTIVAQANVVGGSYDPSARTFQVVVYHTSGTPGVGDPDTGQRINWELVGSINSAGTDLA